MPLSPKGFREGLEHHLLSVLWRHWTALGVATHVPAEDRYPLDLEALLCATLVLSEHDGRLDKLVREWLSANAGLVSTSRLARIWRDFEKTASGVNVGLVVPGKEARIDRWVAGHSFAAGQPGTGARASEEVPPRAGARAGRGSGKTGSTAAPSAWPAAAQLTLRRLFGVNARAEVLLYLVAGTTGSSAGIARATWYDQKSVYRILESWVLAGLCVKAGSPAGRGYGLTRVAEWQRLLGIEPPVAWVDWASTLRPLLLLLRAASTAPRADDEYLLSSLMRGLEAPLASTCRLWGTSFPDSRPRPGAGFFEPAATAALALASAMAGELD
jgi:hypothetical protein